MSMQAIKDVKLNVRPIYIDMSHLYVYEGPCRFGKGAVSYTHLGNDCSSADDRV